MKEFSYRGIFWLPSNPDRRVTGVISASAEDGLHIELTGGLDQSWNDLPSYPVLHGLVEGGKPVSLLDTFVVSRRLGAVTNEKLRVNFLVLGAHTQPVDEQGFRGISVALDLLPEWSGLTPLEHGWQFEGGKLSRLELIYINSPGRADHRDGITYKVSTGFHTEGDRAKSFSIDTTTYLTARPRKHMLLRDLIAVYVTGFQQVLSLSTDYPCALLECQSQVRVQGEGKSWHYEDVEVVFQSRFGRQSDRKVPPPMAFALHFEDFGDDFGEWLARWVKIRSELDSVLGLYFSAIYGPGMLLDQHFMYYVQALETYHRRAIGGTAIAEVKHDERMREILEGAPEGFRTWLRQKLHFSNEPTLRNRLKDLVSHQNDVIEDLVAKRGKFIQLVIDTRNYFTHHDRRLKNRAASGGVLYRTTEVLRYLVAALLLSELGVPQEEIGARLRRSSRYNFAQGQRDFV